MKDYKQDILMVGVGGQGTILASDILGEVAIAAGYDVKKTDTLGMAQRGGSVISHLRIAEKVRSPLIKNGEVDFIIAFEKLEAARWSPYLRSDGLVVINNVAMPPLSVALGTDNYPDDEAIIDIIMYAQYLDHIQYAMGFFAATPVSMNDQDIYLLRKMFLLYQNLP